ncbi:hypothetical protein [Mycobacterium sp. 1274761.0]|uniref:hypothetical protein n=1 Tax=Mycobacterium sp. 1274761.0 TaxID=1834077 RepID=UPI0009ED1961|nr:hypothetical protein [Mycobacterium sp. 1274761.0]
MDRAWVTTALQNSAVMRLKCWPLGKIKNMKTLVRRIATVAAAGIAPLAFITVITPAISHADCTPGTEWFDPIANVCRPTGAPMKNCLPTGWWDPTISDCRPF